MSPVRSRSLKALKSVQGLPPVGEVTSGAPGLASGLESWGAMAIGEGVGRPTALPFQLAPRLYLLSRVGSCPATPAGAAGSDPALGELPQHLIFRESPMAVAGAPRQTWTSEGGSPWSWELAVERHDDTVRATLSATPSDDGVDRRRLVWKDRGDWQAFGSNRLDPESGALEALSLIVEAP